MGGWGNRGLDKVKAVLRVYYKPGPKYSDPLTLLLSPASLFWPRASSPLENELLLRACSLAGIPPPPQESSWGRHLIWVGMGVWEALGSSSKERFELAQLGLEWRQGVG